jgi:hypothetical protein
MPLVFFSSDNYKNTKDQTLEKYNQLVYFLPFNCFLFQPFVQVCALSSIRHGIETFYVFNE